MKPVSTAELAQRVARELSTPEAQARAIIDRSIDMMKKELQRGNCVELPAFLTVSVKQGQPVATTTQSGTTLGLPPATWRALDKCHALRNPAEYEGAVDVDEALLKDLLKAANVVRDGVAALGLINPRA